MKKTNKINKKVPKWMYWTPRIASIVMLLFLAIFSFDVFEEGLGLLNTIKLRRRFKFTEKDFFEATDLPEMERRLEMGILKNAISISMKDPLNISLIIGYIWKKINEVINLRLILRGKQVQIPEQRLMEMVVI